MFILVIVQFSHMAALRHRREGRRRRRLHRLCALTEPENIKQWRMHITPTGYFIGLHLKHILM